MSPVSNVEVISRRSCPQIRQFTFILNSYPVQGGIISSPRQLPLDNSFQDHSPENHFQIQSYNMELTYSSINNVVFSTYIKTFVLDKCQKPSYSSVFKSYIYLPIMSIIDITETQCDRTPC